MITCESCGKLNGREEIGTSWVCEGCKVGVEAEVEDSNESKQA